MSCCPRRSTMFGPASEAEREYLKSLIRTLTISIVIQVRLSRISNFERQERRMTLVSYGIGWLSRRNMLQIARGSPAPPSSCPAQMPTYPRRVRLRRMLQSQVQTATIGYERDAVAEKNTLMSDTMYPKPSKEIAA